MGFEVNGIFEIKSEDLRKIFKCVKKGADFDEAFDRLVIDQYADELIYFVGYILKEQVEAEINRRLKQGK